MAHVLIVGAGPAGALLAHLLAQRGIQVTLLERQSDFAREFRGEILMPSGVDALEQSGLATPLESVPRYTPVEFEAFLNRRSVFTARLDPDFFDGRPPIALSQPGLLEMLVGEAAKAPDFRFERGASVKDLLRDGDRVTGVRVRTPTGEQELRADLVVGADGRSSIIRRRIPLAARRQDVPMDIVWCKLPLPDGFRGLQAYFGRGHLLIAYHSWDGQLQLAWAILKGTYGDLRRQGIEQWVSEMADHVVPDFGAHIRAHTDAISHPFLLDTVSDRVERWSAPGALVIGDAAHTMSPVGAQGLNIALRDAIVVANQLVPALSATTFDADRLDAAARAVEAERLPEVATIQRLQALPPRIVLNRARWAEPVRSAAAALLRTSFGQRRALAFGRVFPFGTTEVRLTV